MATRSATECAAIVDVCRRLKLVDEESAGAARELLVRIIAMLIRMVLTSGESGTGTGTGTGTGGQGQGAGVRGRGAALRERGEHKKRLNNEDSRPKPQVHDFEIEP